MNKVELSKINEVLGESPEVFICNASFEDRCLSIAQAIDTSNLRNAIILWNEDYIKEITENLDTLEKIFSDKTNKIKLRTDKQLESADKLREEVIPIIKNCERLCVIDVTTFTHEHLLILLRLIFELAPFAPIKLLYTGADNYSTNTKEEDTWLSKGVFDIRTVLGYSGIMFPSRKSHLIVLVGFEVERAEILISYYEPSLISLGYVRRGQSVKEEFTDKNLIFHKRVKEFIKEMVEFDESVIEFEFSSVDPIDAMSDILFEVKKNDEYNTVICPLNTKPSTIGAALAAMKYEKIQLVYAQPVEYNTKGYSTPGKSATILDLNNLFSLADLH